MLGWKLDCMLSLQILFCLLQELMDGEAVKKLMSLLLAIGNYMNSGI